MHYILIYVVHGWFIMFSLVVDESNDQLFSCFYELADFDNPFSKHRSSSRCSGSMHEITLYKPPDTLKKNSFGYPLMSYMRGKEAIYI